MAGERTVQQQPGTGQTNQNNQNGQTNQNAQDNKQNQVATFEDLWQDDSQEQDNSQQQQNREQNTNQQTVTPEQVMERHLKSLGFGIQLSQEDLGRMQNGDMEPLQTQMTDLANKVYTTTLQHMSQFVDRKISDGIDKGIQRVLGTTRLDASMSRLHEELPFTKKESIRPVAKAVFQQMLKKNKGDVDEAIKNTREYFVHTSNLSAKDLGIRVSPKSKPGSSQRNVANQDFDQQINEDDETDWFSYLSEG